MQSRAWQEAEWAKHKRHLEALRGDSAAREAMLAERAADKAHREQVRQRREQKVANEQCLEEALKGHGENKMGSASQKHILVEESNMLDYLKSEHTMEIQDSVFIQIEDNRERLWRQTKNILSLSKAKLDKQEKDGSQKHQQLNLRYCSEEQIARK